MAVVACSVVKGRYFFYFRAWRWTEANKANYSIGKCWASPDVRGSWGQMNTLCHLLPKFRRVKQ